MTEQPEEQMVSGITRSSATRRVIADIQDWIDHPFWDAEFDTDRLSMDISDCLSIFGIVVASDSQPPVASLLVADAADDPQSLDDSLPEISPARFRDCKLKGSGAFGIVLQAHDCHLDVGVALKILRPSRVSSSQHQRRFLREAQAAAILEHPGIVRVFGTGRVCGYPVIVSNFIEGPNLAEFLHDRGGRLPVEQSAALIAQVADAVQYAHERGVLHRDLKPANLLLARRAPGESSSSAGMFPQLTDFGLAKRLMATTQVFSPLSNGHVTLGTLEYMSPEQAAGRLNDVGTASDIYSLGVILYECLVGRTPHDDGDRSTLLTNILNRPVGSLRTKMPELSRDLDHIVRKCLQSNPHDRYRTAGELADDLRRFLASEPVRARDASLARQIWCWSRRNRLSAVLTAISIVLLCGLTILQAVSNVRLRQSSDQIQKSILAQQAATQEARNAVVRQDESLSLAYKAVSDAYLNVAEEVLADVPNAAKRRYDLHKTALSAHRTLAEQSGFDARSRYRLSVAYHYAGTAAERVGELEESNRYRSECVTLLEKLAAEDPSNQTYLYDLFFNRKCIVDIDPGTGHKSRLARKLQLHDDIMALVALAPTNPDYLDAAASMKAAIADEARVENPALAERFLEEAYRISDSLFSKYPDRLLYAKYALICRASLADIKRAANHLDAALQLGLDATSRLESIEHVERDKPWFLFIALEPRRSLAETYFARQDWNRAIPQLQKVEQIARALCVHHPENSRHFVVRAEALVELTRVLTFAERNDELPGVRAEAEVALDGLENYPYIAARASQFRKFLNEPSLTASPLEITH